MLQRLIAAVLAVLGLAAIGLGVASATAWRADDPLVATAAPGGDNRTLVTDPGVLELAGDPVTVTVRAEGSPVVLVLGRDTDVTAWVGSDPYVRVTGLSDWHTLATTAVTAPEPTASPSASASPAPTPSPSPSGAAGDEAGATAADPTGNDMWVTEVTGDGSATLAWPAQDGRWSLLAVSLGDTAPVLDLSWPQTVTTPWLWPGVALGVLLLAAAMILLVRILRRRREGPDAGWHPVTTGQIAVVTPAGTGAGAETPATAGAPGAPTGAVRIGTISATGAPLTRRQIREAEAEAAAAAAAARRRGRRNATGAIPTVTGAVPTVTGAVPTVTGSSPADPPAAPAVAGTPGSPTPAAPAPTAPAGPPSPAAPPPAAGAGPGTPVQRAVTGTAGPDATRDRTAPAPHEQASAADRVVPAADAAVGSGAADGAGPDATGDRATPEPDAPARRGIAARMPWRRSRPGPATEPSAPGTPEPTGASAPATSWSPVPGAPVGAGRTAAPPARPAAPPTPATTPAPGGAAPGTGDDDPAAQAQRADAWRRMWGFPSDATGPTDGGTADGRDQQGTEEGR